MQNEIVQAIELLDQKIESLKKLRDQLASEFGQAQIHVRAKPITNAHTNGHGVGRKDQVANFIKEHGPSSRAEIIQGTGIPIGTVAYALNDERFISRNGKWQVKDEKPAP